MPLTSEQQKRVEKDWSAIAGEPLKIQGEKVRNGLNCFEIYAFGSELACLRLHYKMQKGRVKYSTNMTSWFYANF